MRAGSAVWDRWVALALLAVLVVSAAGCANRLPRRPAYETSSRRVLYRANLTERQRVGMATANLSLWLQRSTRRFPGASGDVALVAPNWFRLRINSAFGTLVDLGMLGDTVVAYVPSWRTGLVLESAAESLHIERPGALGYRAFAGAWDPPDEAWDVGAVWTDSLLEISWKDFGDSLTLGVRGDGLPAWIRLKRPTSDVRLSYQAWDRAAGPSWPSWLILDSRSADLRLTIRTSQLRFASRVDPTRLNVRMPDDTQEMTVEQLRELLGRLGAER